MFDEHQTPRLQFETKIPVIVLACGGGGILLSFGLCGAAAALPNRGSTFTGALGIIGLVVMGISVAAVLVGILWLITAALINAFRR